MTSPKRTGFILAPPCMRRQTIATMQEPPPRTRPTRTLHIPKRARAPSTPPSPPTAQFDLLSLAVQPATHDHLQTLSFLDLPHPAPIPARKPPRKPHGFWNDLANIERELLAVNNLLNRQGRKIVPRLSEMNALHRGDLVAAISKHGGVKKVAEALHWGRGGKTRRAVGEPAARPTAAAATGAGKRVKILRRPKAYWDDVMRVEIEIGAFVDEYGVKGVMPTQKQFYSFGRADLVNAAGRHGGLRRIAARMGLKCRRAPRRTAHWKDFEVVKEAIMKFSIKYCEGRMPTRDELCQKGESAVANAIVAHGGFPGVAKKCGLVARNTNDQGAPVRWDEKRLKRELFSFTMTYYPALAREMRMPSERMLRKFGRNDLSYAVSKFGGFHAVSKLVGLRMKKYGPVVRSKSDVGKSA